MLPQGPAPIRLDTTSPAAAALRPGISLETFVQGGAGKTFLFIQGVRVPLGAETGLTPGQAVRVDVVAGASRPALQVTPLTPDTSAPRQVSAMTDLLAPILTRLGAETSAAHAARMLPNALPLSPQHLHQMLALFFEQGRLAEDLRQLASLLTAAAKQAPDLATAAQFIEGRAGALTAQTVQEWRQLLAREGKGHALEARIARAIEEGRLEMLPALFREDLRAQVAALRGNAALLAYLRGTRRLREFEEIIQRITDRLSGGEMQKLRSLEQPYHFIEIPVAPESGLTRAQIHFFGDGAAGAKGAAGENSVVLDLELTRLGALWVALRQTAAHCDCRVQSASPPVRKALEAAREELEDGLVAAGYRTARVSVVPWNGDRIGAVAALMDRFGGLRVDA